MSTSCNYTSVMIMAYSRLTERTIEESLLDLRCLDTIDPAEVLIVNRKEEELLLALLKDPEGIMRWVDEDKVSAGGV